MAGIGRFYYKLAEVVGGVQTFLAGSVLRPVKEFATTGTKRSKGQTITIAAGATATIWDYASTGTGFDLMTIECDGYADVAIKADKATSASDRTALGTHVGYNHIGLSCNAPLVLPGDDVVVNTSAANLAGNAFHAGNTAGKVYQIQAKNPGASTITITLAWID